jgi:hypothetical protein
MSYAQWRNSYTRFFFCSFRYHFNSCIGVYSGLSGRVRTVYLFSICVVSLLSSRFTASALVWIYNFLKYLIFHLFISLSIVSFVALHGSCGGSCTKCVQNGSESLGLKALEEFDVGIGGCPP